MSQPAPDLRVDEGPSKLEIIGGIVRENLPWLMLAAVGMLVFLWWTGFQVKVPRGAKIGTAAGIVFAPVGLLTGMYLKSLIHDPRWIYLIDIEAEDPEHGMLYRFESYDFSKIEVVKGELDSPGPLLHFGRNVDLEDGTVEGNWRGTMSDRKLLRSLHLVWECRNQLEEDAQRGFAIESTAWIIVRRAARDAVRRVTEMFEDRSLPDKGDAIERAIDEALEEYDLDSELEEVVDDPVVDHDEIETFEDLKERRQNGGPSEKPDPAERGDMTVGDVIFDD